jgi:AcrR family transcriptional regulator
MTSRSGRDPERRAQLLDAADRAIARHGAGVRMEDVAAEAGVTKPIVYRHFGDKGGLYEALARRFAGQLMERLTAAMAAADDPLDKLTTTIDAYLAAIEERPELYRFLLHRAAAERPEVTQAVGDFTYQLADRVAATLADEFGRFGFELSQPQVAAHGLIGLVHQVSDWWMSTGTLTRDELRDTVVHLLWAGLPSVGAGSLSGVARRWREGTGGA